VHAIRYNPDDSSIGNYDNLIICPWGDVACLYPAAIG